METLLPSLEKDGIKVGVFMTEYDGFVLVSVEEFLNNLIENIEMYADDN